eukprot:1654587-Pyramimonas_sp.AAC.1
MSCAMMPCTQRIIVADIESASISHGNHAVHMPTLHNALSSVLQEYACSILSSYLDLLLGGVQPNVW